MALPTPNHLFKADHIGPETVDDPNLFLLSEIQTAIGVTSTTVSLATSGVVSTAASGALDSVPVSTAASKAESASTRASTADSKAISASGPTSVVDSKALSNSLNISVADSKAVSVATAVPTVTAVVYSGAISIADSKATSSAASAAPPNLAFNVKLAPYSAVGNGTADDTAAILAADVAAAAAGGEVFFPPGTYKTSQNLVCSRKWRGVPGVSIIKPTAAVTKCVDLRTNGNLEGLYLDGTNTTGATGIDVGSALLVNQMVVRDVQVWSFTGGAGRGIKLAQCVTASFVNVYCALNYINLDTLGTGGTPTDTVFINCQFLQAVTKGVWIENGYSIRFLKCLFQSNGEEGLYLQNTGDNALEIGLSYCWFESNWQSVASGAARHTHYDFFCDGATGPSGTIRFSLRDNKHAEGATGARAMHITNALGYQVDNCKVTNEAGQILVDGTSYGQFPSWPAGNGAFKTTVSANFVDPTVAWNSQSQLVDGVWTAAPALQNSWVNYGGVTGNAQYILDVSGWVHLAGMIKNGTTTPGTLLFTLPAGSRPIKQVILPTVSNDVAASISVGTDGTVRTNAGASATYLSLDGLSFRVS